MPHHKPTTLTDRLGALRGLLTISDEDYTAYLRSYDELFVDSPENTKADYEAGVELRGYPQGSSSELTELYKVIHLLCTLGSVEKMYMPPTIDADRSVLQNQILFEQIVAGDLQLRPGDKVLDLGCGCGAIAEHMAELTGATPYGVNLDRSQNREGVEEPEPADGQLRGRGLQQGPRVRRCIPRRRVRDPADDVREQPRLHILRGLSGPQAGRHVRHQ